MEIKKEKRSSTTSTSPCAHLRTAYHNCFNKWYSDKFVKGQWNKEEEECVPEWQKYRACLSKHLQGDKHLSRFLEQAEENTIVDSDSANNISDSGNPSWHKGMEEQPPL